MNPMEQEIREEEFTLLLEKGQQLHRDHPGSGWIVVLKTTQGNLYQAIGSDINILDFSAEDAMVQEMAERNDTQMKRIVCLHSENCVGVVSANLRLKLRDLNPQNMDAEILLQGLEPGTYGYRIFAQIFPPTKEKIEQWIKEGRIPDPSRNKKEK